MPKRVTKQTFLENEDKKQDLQRHITVFVTAFLITFPLLYFVPFMQDKELFIELVRATLMPMSVIILGFFGLKAVESYNKMRSELDKHDV